MSLFADSRSYHITTVHETLKLGSKAHLDKAVFAEVQYWKQKNVSVLIRRPLRLFNGFSHFTSGCENRYAPYHYVVFKRISVTFLKADFNYFILSLCPFFFL